MSWRNAGPRGAYDPDWRYGQVEPKSAWDAMRQVRIKEGITQNELAQRAGIGRAHLAQIEKGNKRLTDKVWGAVGQVLDLSAIEVEFFWEGRATNRTVRLVKEQTDLEDAISG